MLFIILCDMIIITILFYYKNMIFFKKLVYCSKLFLLYHMDFDNDFDSKIKININIKNLQRTII